MNVETWIGLHSFEKQRGRAKTTTNKHVRDAMGRKRTKEWRGGGSSAGPTAGDKRGSLYFFSTTFDFDPDADLTLSTTMASVISSGRVMKNSVEKGSNTC